MTSSKLAIIFLVILLLVNVYPGAVLKWYIKYPSFDIALHFLGGFFVSMLIFSFYRDEFRKTSFFFQSMALAGIALGIGVVWEFAEYIGSRILVEPIYNAFKLKIFFMGDLDDTISDLFMDALGAILFIVLHFFRSAHSQKRKSLP